MWLLALFIAVPLIEIALFIQVGGFIGLWATLAVVLVTAVLGTFLVRQQGALALSELRRSFSDLQDPTRPLAHGAMILFSGALLLTPGFFTDGVGFLLLVPAFRDVVIREVAKRIRIARFDMGSPSPQEPTQSTTIEGDFTEVPADRSADSPSGWRRH